MKYCSFCGASLNDGAAFCANCGSRIITPQAPVQPAYQAPVQPAYQAPVQPVYQAPVQPVFEEPVQPVYQAPAQPVFEEPVQHVYQEPAQPVFEEPVQPVFEEPVQPVFEEPVQHVFEEMEPPIYQAPVQPEDRIMEQPAYQEPVQPAYQEPVQPAYQEPVQPVYQQPVQPVYQEPIQPVYQQPVQPQNAPDMAYAQPMGMPPANKIRTNRGWIKFWLLSIITFGIYGIVVMSHISQDINVIATRYDGKTTKHYCLIFFLFSWLTLGIAPIVWTHKISNRIGNEVSRRGFNYSFGSKTFWLWGVLGSLIVVGPIIFIRKLFKAMNIIADDYNKHG